MDLSGKRILVTGGGSGLGRVLAEDFAAAGGDVHICGRRPEPLQAVTDATHGITAHILDVTDETATDAMFESIGHADIVIANAGIAESAPLHRTSTEMWHRIMAVNLTGCFLTFRAGLQQLRNAKCSWGRLIAISSITGLSGHRYASAYSASKHGVNGLVRSTAAELASSGITANALCPGYLDTEMTDRSIDNIIAKTGKSREDATGALAEMSPLGRLITPQEVSTAALWLCGPGSDAVNGQTIAINGGEG
ncbi:MAG: SDR family oxidoreductase [Alphaproteobacteria bacterium]|nr:3-hydroxyacyl-CoA dehydrogenase [Rhodospirillaceae bacterium]MBL6673014.1 SDR family oxidoreductase [Alphaproteobacteria bacterium]